MALPLKRKQDSRYAPINKIKINFEWMLKEMYFMKKMINIRNICWTFFLVIQPAFFGCAQSKSIVKKAQAYYTERLPGNIPVYPNGQERPGKLIDTIYVVYVETSSAQVSWETADKNGRFFNIVASLQNQDTVNVGLRKDNNDPVIIIRNKGRYLWRLDLVPDDSRPRTKSGSGKAGILIKGKHQGKGIKQLVENPVELYTPPSV
jgi:hypothetical protein